MSNLTPSDEARLDRERALAAEMFPAEWAAALAMTGKRGNGRRAKLRQRAVAELVLRPLRAAGASCASCRHYRTTLALRREPTRFCEIDSDWQGYAIRKPTDLCTAYDGSVKIEVRHDR